jgi:2-polyprenyl-6-hydroxyphenyl methylase/3-demethylubiquinone-9 3-methyltransferase
MPIDNEMYDRLSATWWEEDAFLNVLKSGLNPARVGYIRRVLTKEMELETEGLPVLDVGCGGGLLAEEVASIGCRVTGVDPSTESLAVARAHAEKEGLEIEYLEATGEDLPFDDGTFPVVYCCDVLEHVNDLGRTIGEIARVSVPGAVFIYDTINRTWRSRLLMIKISQDWSSTAWAEPNLHDFEMFIKPDELEAKMTDAGFDVRDRIGFSSQNPSRALKAMWYRAHGRITYAEMGERLQIRESRDTSSSYGGYAVKAGYTLP